MQVSDSQALALLVAVPKGDEPEMRLGRRARLSHLSGITSHCSPPLINFLNYQDGSTPMGIPLPQLPLNSLLTPFKYLLKFHILLEASSHHLTTRGIVKEQKEFIHLVLTLDTENCSGERLAIFIMNGNTQENRKLMLKSLNSPNVCRL